MQYRTELKYICDPIKMMRIEDCVRALCMPDPHVGADGSYLIRSLYLDSPDMMYYLQTKNGVDHRHKYRIRVYNRSDDRITLERKESFHGRKHKVMKVISHSDYDDIISGKEIPSEDDELKAFMIDMTGYGLAPKTIIEYVRFPYVHPVGNVRITFDKNILASDSSDLFAGHLTGAEVLDLGLGILEVKYDDVLPGAISRMLGSFDLQAVSFSKYVRAIDAMRGNIGD